MLAQMMKQSLQVSSILEHADRFHGDTEIVSRTIEGPIHRYTYAEAHSRAKQLANALQKLGVSEGDRVATLAWNGYRHFELYYAVAGVGAITHTVNPRLFEDQITWIINNAEDLIVCFDISFTAIVEKLAPNCPSVKHWIAMTDPEHMPAFESLDLLCYESLVEDEAPVFDWPVLDEDTACALCYTSGTTGNPKGVLYSHRSTLLHAMASCMPDALSLSACDTVLPVVPMFHVNAWGLPYSAPISGSKLVFPGPHLDGKNLFDLFEQESVTFSAGVPTVWLGLLEYLRAENKKLSTVERMVVGGAACPPALMKSYRDEFGIRLQHAWGMTELSPLGTVATLKSAHASLDADEKFDIEIKQGRPIFGIDLKIVDENGNVQPHDGKLAGDLLVRGHWVVQSYFRRDESPLVEGWFPSGDVANIDPDGFMQITDRSKDVIKSGGEWISSIELENIAMAHPGVAEAAAIGVRHPKWDERPLLVVVKKANSSVSRDDILSMYSDKVAKFCVPDDVVMVDEIPHTATGKVSKLRLREMLSDYQFPNA